MLGHDPFNHDTIRKTTIIFGGLFNDIKINRSNANGAVDQIVNVPINYGAAEKTLRKLKQEPDLTPPYAMTLPRMSFELDDIQYNPDLKFPSLNQTVSNGISYYPPVPFNLKFELYIMANKTADGTRILEQILPFFTPTYNVPANMIPELGLEENIPITITGFNKQDDYQGSFDDKRTYIWTLGFMAQVNLYGPTSDAAGKLIKHIDVEWFDNTTANVVKLANTTIEPGLTANGQGTTNSQDSIPWANINYDDPWAFIVDLEN